MPSNAPAPSVTVRQRVRAMWASAGCVAGALLLVLLLGGWGAYQDWQRIKLATLQAEITQVRSHAERTAGQIESQLMDMGQTPNLKKLLSRPGSVLDGIGSFLRQSGSLLRLSILQTRCLHTVTHSGKERSSRPNGKKENLRAWALACSKLPAWN